MSGAVPRAGSGFARPAPEPLLSGTVSFDAGATGAALTRTFEVAIADDDADELNTETFTVTLGTASPDAAAAVAVGTPPASVETTITDGDMPVASISGPSSVGEDANLLGDGMPVGDDTAITVMLDREPAAEVTVSYTVGGGTAHGITVGDTGPVDYVYISPTSVIRRGFVLRKCWDRILA